MNTRSLRVSCLIFALGLLFAALPVARALAASSTPSEWTGAIDDNWTVPGNWDRGVPSYDGYQGAISNGGVVRLDSGDQMTYAFTVDRGTLNITNGATLTVTYPNDTHGNIMIGLDGHTGTITVSGNGSRLTANNIIVGSSGKGVLSISSGGRVSADRIQIGRDAVQGGTVTVSGTGSILETPDLIVGVEGIGFLHIANGGQVIDTGSKAINIGRSSGSTGLATVDGSGSELVINFGLSVGYNGGAGTLTLSNGGKVLTPYITIGNDGFGSGAIGTLNIGAGAGDAAAAPGIVNAEYLTTSINASGTLQFNHTRTAADPYYLTRDGGSGGDAVQLRGSLSVAHTAGYTVLNGNNTFTGGTTISGGTLAVGHDSALGRGTVSLNGGTLGFTGAYNIANAVTVSAASAIDVGGNTITLGGSISGGGNLAKSGGGTLILANNGNNYTGTATVGAGTLQVGTGGLVYGTVGNFVINSGANVTFSHSSAPAYNGGISGAGSLTVAGNLTLTGDATHSGGTTISSGGSLMIGNGGATGGISGDIVNNSANAVVFNRSTDLTYGGGISGSAGLFKFGAGKLTLSGAHSYTGNTYLDEGGRLEITGSLGSGNTYAGEIDMAGTWAAPVELIFNQTGDQTLSGRLAVDSNPAYGYGTLTKTNTGTLILANNNTLRDVNVNQGVLQIASGNSLTVNNALGVAAGATLGLYAGASPAVNAATISAQAGAILNVEGFAGEGQYTLIHTSGGISGDFTLHIAGAAPPAPGLGSFMNASLQKISGSNDLAIQQSLVWNQATDAHGTFAIASGDFTLAAALADNTTPGAGATYGWDGASLTKIGAGTLILTGANTYTGATTVNQGTLAGNIANNTNLTVAAGATYDGTGENRSVTALSGAGTVTNFANLTAQNGAFGGVISGGGSLTKSGAGNLILSGANTYAGGTTVSGGSLTVTGTLGNGSYAGAIANAGSLVFDQTGSQTLSGGVSGSGSLTKSGSGALTMAGDVSQGSVAITGGSLNIASGNSLTAGGNVSVASGATLGLYAGASPAVNAATVTVAAGAILNVEGFGGTGEHTLIRTTGGISGDFTLHIAGAAPPAPGLGSFMNVGLEKINGNNELAIQQSLVWNQGTNAHGTFDIASGDFTLAAALADNTIPGAGATHGWDGASLTKTGAGTLILTGANTYSGGTTVNAGTLSIGGDGNIGAGTNTLAGGTLRLTGNSYGKDWTLGAGGNAIDTPGDTTFNGVLGGAGGFAKIGAGTLILTGANAYSGGTTVNAGTLSIGSDGNIGTGTNTLDGGTLRLTGNAYGKDWTLGAGSNAIDTPDDTAFNGVLGGAGGFAKTGAGTLTLGSSNGYTGGTRIDNGVLRLTDSGAAGAGDIVTGASGSLELAFNGAFGNLVGGSGNLSVDAGAGTVSLAGANAYTGLTSVRSGTLALSGVGRISDMLELRDQSAFDAGGMIVDYINRLDVRGRTSWTGDLHMAGKAMNFYIPEFMGNGQTMLTVSGTAHIASAQVNVGIDGASSPLQAGDRLVLLDAGVLDGAPGNAASRGQGMLGVTLKYDFDIVTEGDQLIATVASSGSGNSQTKALSEGFLAGLAMAAQGSDLIAGLGMREAVNAARRAGASGPYGLGGFGAVSGGKSRYDTGSHVDMTSVSLLAGVSFGADLRPGRLTLGAFFEYGNGSYDTYNSFSNAASVRGRGDTYYLGGGALGRMDFADTGPGRIYAEASFRAGSLHNDYNNSDLRDAFGRRADYDSDSTYYGFHLGAGYLWNISDKASLDLYGKYFWTRVEGDSVKLSTGDPVRFKDADSSRLRLGGRFAYAINEYVSPYIGAAWEHEFDGRARATTNGYSLEAPSLRGDTGIGELGLSLQPSQDLPLFFDLGVQGYTGKREGVTGSLQAKWEF